MNDQNERLSALIAEANFSWAGLARRVNDLGLEEGLALRYDYTAVNRWVKKGERPRLPVPSLIAVALSERLGRRISPPDFGMVADETLAARGLVFSDKPEETIDVISELGRADVKRRSVVAAPFVLAAFGGPSRDWLLAQLDQGADERGPRKVGMRQVAGIRDMFALFQEMDVLRGGGHARTALAEYLNSYVIPLLKQDHEPQVNQAIREAAAEQAYLLGWMAYDDGEHGLAQRYLIQALGLAQAAESPALGAHVLAGMSDQANLLGHPREALMLARAGRNGITEQDSPACLADLYILEARALAASGDRGGTVTAVAQAERLFERIVPEDEPEWARFIDAPYLYGEAAHCFRDLGDPAAIDQFANESIRIADQQNRARRGALSTAASAVADLHRGEVEAAAAKSLQVVELASSVNSSRCVETVRDLQRRLRPHTVVEGVARFNEQARESLGLAA